MSDQEIIDHCPEFEPFKKIPRLTREIVITEKIDGTNAQVCIAQAAPGVHIPEATARVRRYSVNGANRCEIDYAVFAGSRSRWLMPGKKTDNFGFAEWVHDNVEELVDRLGVGRHFGEWWGQGINRAYGLDHKRFSLFNVSRWSGINRGSAPECCSVVPILYEGPFLTDSVDRALENLSTYGSFAAPGFPSPEGVIVFHKAGNVLFKKTIEKDEEPKSLKEAA